MSKTILYVHVYKRLDFPITYRNASMLCQSECACLHTTGNMLVFFVKSNENTYPKGRTNIQKCPYNDNRVYNAPILYFEHFPSITVYHCFNLYLFM